MGIYGQNFSLQLEYQETYSKLLNVNDVFYNNTYLKKYKCLDHNFTWFYYVVFGVLVCLFL